MAYQKVVVIGVEGRLGAPLIKDLLASTTPKFNVTVLARPTSSYAVPEGIDTANLTVVKVDFTNHHALVEALRGQDAIVLTITSMNDELKPTSISIIDAAIEAGVKWIMPSDFGGDPSPLTAFLFGSKEEVHNHLLDKVNEGKITYNEIRNGVCFDIGLEAILGFNLKERKVGIYKGHRKFHSTTRASISTAIVNILREPSKFTNKILHIHDFFINQPETLDIVESVTGETFVVEELDAEELGKKALEKIKSGKATKGDGVFLTKWSIWSEDTSCRWDTNDDSVSLGLGGVDLKEEVEKYIKASQQGAGA